MNSCPINETTLNDYFDGMLSEEESRKVVCHLESCNLCSATLRDLESLREHVDRLPSSVEPAEDLWPKIADKLSSRPTRVLRVSGYSYRVAALVLGAAAMLILGFWTVFNGLVPFSDTYTGDRQPAGDTVFAEVAGAEETYVDAAGMLFAQVEAYKHFMPEGVVESISLNLNITGAAIRDLRVALEKDPDNTELTHKLMDAHAKQVKLLQDIIRIPHNLYRGAPNDI